MAIKKTMAEKEIGAGEALAVLVKKIGSYGSWVLSAVLILVVLVQYQMKTNPFNPNPAPSPPSVVVVDQKTLRDLVPVEVANQWAKYYHSLASNLYLDGIGPNGVNTNPDIKTAKDFKTVYEYSIDGLIKRGIVPKQNALDGPVQQKFLRAIPNLSTERTLDDPAAPIRASLVAICKEISEELNPEFRNKPLTSL